MIEALPQLLLNAIITGSIYALAGAGVALTFGLLRILNFAHGHLMMVGAYITYWLAVESKVSLPTTALLSTVLVALVALVTLEIFVRPFSKYHSLLPLITTLTLATILESLVSIQFGVTVKSFDAPLTSFNFYGMYITPSQIVIIASAVVVMVGMALIIHGTSWGRVLRALTEHPESVAALGISDRLFTTIVFVLGTVLAAYAGVLVGYETNIQPTMGSQYTIKAFAAMVLGGLGNVWGTIIGCYVLGLLENLSVGISFGDWSIPSGYKEAFSFVIILFVLLIKPYGIFGKPPRDV